MAPHFSRLPATDVLLYGAVHATQRPPHRLLLPANPHPTLPHLPSLLQTPPTSPSTHPPTPHSVAGWVGELQGGISYFEYIRGLVARVDSDWDGIVADLEAIR